MNHHMTPDIAFNIIKEKWQDKKFIAHTCSICEYPCGFVWKNGNLFYDSGCDCVENYLLEPREEKELLDFLRREPSIVALNFCRDELCTEIM